MKDEIIIKTLMDTEISVLEEFVKKVEDSPKVLEDDKFVSRANFDILKGYLGALKKMRETGWRNYQIMKNDSDIAIYREPEPMPINLMKERDNWRDMYDKELKKNDELGHKLLLANYDRDMKVKKLEKERDDAINRSAANNRKVEILEKENDELKKKLSWNEEMLSNRYSDINRLKKENDELSRINSVRLGDINRLQDKVDKLDSLIDTIDRAYPTVYVNYPFRSGYDENITKFCMTCADMLSDWKKL